MNASLIYEAAAVCGTYKHQAYSVALLLMLVLMKLSVPHSCLLLVQHLLQEVDPAVCTGSRP